MKCPTKKICFISKEVAEEELLANRAKYNYSSGTGPINVYKCDVCEYYHFTSKGEMNSRLLSKDSKKKIDRESEANYWLNKLK
ncbi:MAG: hypothetical protein ACNS60_12450 [Candidatus Cyclobacteriaceae bacterium M2_1C_046]